MVLTNNHRLLSQINLMDDRILIHNLEILGKDAVDYLQRVPEEERDRTYPPHSPARISQQAGNARWSSLSSRPNPD